MNKIGLILVLDGANGGGKSGAIVDIARHLRAKGHEVVCTAEPGGTPIGNKIRVLARDPESTEMSNLTGMLLFAAARAQNVAEVIRPALERQCIVLVDRFSASSRSFQYAGQGMPLELVTLIDSIARDGVDADYTLIFDLDPLIGLQRTGARSTCDDKFELTGLEFLNRVRNEYLVQAQETPDRFEVIDASKTYDQVLEEAISAIDGYIACRLSE
ncbi:MULTISPECIES: dTMP kinase [Pseudomonas]|uniref:dTMP kinase n=1 Tax=Pseudomonas TaxID=286 RepID=UPI000F03B4A5|nr:MULTISPECIES: dTMP kinase [Pseudomonas]MBD8682138.1 dTMP kinase [Pseudomonas sp. CFBP 13719]